MSASASVAVTASTTAEKIRKEKKRGASTLKFKDYLRLRMDEAGLMNVELAEILKYPRPNVIAMMKSGDMKLPLNMIKPTATALGVDPVFLLEKVTSESDPKLWEALKDIVGDRLVTANELRLIELVRAMLNGHDIDLTNRKEFLRAVEPVISEIVEREIQLNLASLSRIEEAKKKAA